MALQVFHRQVGAQATGERDGNGYEDNENQRHWRVANAWLALVQLALGGKACALASA